MLKVKAIACLIATVNSKLISIISRVFQFASSFTSTMTNPARVYCEESSIHGFPYIANQQLHPVERLLWIVALICSFICCGVKFKEDAMVTYTSDDAISVTNVSVGLRFSSSSHQSQVSDSVRCCPDLESHNDEFDFNQIVSAIKNKEISISNLTETEFVVDKFCRIASATIIFH
jgi:hypothetical protein